MQFDASNREERAAFDNPADSKLSRRQGRQGRFGSLGGLGALSIWTDSLDLDDDDDDDDTLGRLLQPRGSPTSRSAGAAVALDELEAEKTGGRAGRGRGKDKEHGGVFGYAVSGLTADMRNGERLPEGLEVVGGDPTYEEQEDGSQALLIPEGAYLKVTLPHVSPFSLEDDGRLHRFSLMLALRLDRLPAATLPLFNGSGPPAAGEQLESVQVYKNGGVGALGHMGAQDATVRAERWAWVAVTRKEGELKTYVNGRLCADIKLETAKLDKKAGSRATRSLGADGADEGGGKDGKGKGSGKDGAPAPERFCVDPQHLALFAAREPTEAELAGDDGGERGLALRFVKLVSTTWSEDQVREELNTLRGKDQEAELQQEAEAARSEQLSLQPLYAKPPPVWLHPAFAAEFGDAFIGGTGLEAGSLHISLEVVVLALQRMVADGGAASGLPHAQRAALSTACSLLDDAKKLAHKFSHAMGHQGQQRMYLSRAIKALEGLEPGAMLVLPCAVGGCPVIFIVQRQLTPAEELCTFTVVSCDPEALDYHHTAAQPPKIKFATCLTLKRVRLKRLLDEAFWAVLWFTATSDESGRLSPLQMLYGLLLSFLCEDSLEQAMLRSSGAAAAPDADEMHTPRRSTSAHYGCVRHTLRFLLRIFGAGVDACRRISLLLRAELLEMAQHDLGFAQFVTPAERSILHIACRQLAYKAAKLGSPMVAAAEASAGRPSGAGSSSSDAPSPPVEAASLPLSVSEIAKLRERVERLRTTLKAVPGAAPASTAPPPLILSEADVHLGRPSLPLLLGEGAGGRLLLPPQAAAAGVGAADTGDTDASSAGAGGSGGSNGRSGGGGGGGGGGGSDGGEAWSPAHSPTAPRPAARTAVVEAYELEAAGDISAQERQRRIAATYQQGPRGRAGTDEVGVEETLAEVEVLGLYFAASWCPSCRSTTPVIASSYKALRGRGKALQIVFVSQDGSESDFEAYRRSMPWPALPHGGSLPALLAEIFHVTSIPCLVLLNKEGGLISTDGVRLLRKHARSFPWSSSTPVETPHHHPLFERLMRRQPVDTGAAHDLPTYTPIDFLQQPSVVHTLDEALAAIRHCDRLCTLVAVQAHCVKNTCFLKISLIQHTFTQLLPLPRPEGHKEESTCLWRSPLLYSQQLDIMLLLQRIIEHFASSVFTVDHTRSIDAVRMVVPACIAAIADAIMRQIAVDIPSEVSIHLRGTEPASKTASKARRPPLAASQLPASSAPASAREEGAAALDGLVDRGRAELPSSAAAADGKGKAARTAGAGTGADKVGGRKAARGFGLGVAALARQSASVPVHTPELNTARTSALDYFNSQAGLPHIFAWEKTERLEKGTSKWLGLICADLAFPADEYNTPRYISDSRELVIKNFPEFRCYRDIAFYYKLFLNPDIRRFPPKSVWVQKDAELVFHWDDGSERFYVTGFQDTTLSGRPRVKRGEMPPAHRFPSMAQPSEYTRPYFIDSEDDVLHMWELPDFGELDVGHARALGQQDAELLLSFLTVPYLRIPLVMSFFASDDRCHSLQSPTLQALLDAVLFEPGAHLPLESDGYEPIDVPTSSPTLLGTPHHLLINELSRSPDTLLSSLLTLLKQAADLDTGTLKSSTATVILYVVRLCCRIDSYIAMVLDYDAGTHDCIRGKPFRQLQLAEGVAARLVAAQSELRRILWGDVTSLMQTWYFKLVRECDGSDDDRVLDANTKHMCNIHAHLLLTLRNVPVRELTEGHVTSVITGMVFLSTRHEWNMALLDRKGAASFDGWRVPENEIYEAVHVLRRKLVHWLRERVDQRRLDAIMDSVVRVSASTGSLLPRADEVPNRWAHVAGERNSGRFALHSSRSKSKASSASSLGSGPPSLSRQTTAASDDASSSEPPALSRQASAAADERPAGSEQVHMHIHIQTYTHA